MSLKKKPGAEVDGALKIKIEILKYILDLENIIVVYVYFFMKKSLRRNTTTMS